MLVKKFVDALRKAADPITWETPSTKAGCGIAIGVFAMTWTTIGYRIESCSIEQYPRCYRQVWFLDAVQVNADGRTSTSNICSGTKEYCLETMAVQPNVKATPNVA